MSYAEAKARYACLLYTSEVPSHGAIIVRGILEE